ncbi:MAG: nuclear transport factor 2 family protein [Halioglobus sp.]
MGAANQHKAMVNRFFDALNKGDVDTVVNTYAENGQVQTMGGTLISGTFSKEDISNSVKGIFDVFPKGIRFSIDDMVAEGNKVAVEAKSEGEHVSGQTYRNEYHFLFEFLDGKLVKLKEYMDTELVTDVLCGGQRPPFSS